MADMCTTCLSKDKTLAPIGHEHLQILNKLCYPKTLVLNNRIVKLCLQCDSDLKDVNEFRTKASKSLDYLNEIWNNTDKIKPVLDISPQTKLVQSIEENNLSNIKIEETREVLDETEVNIKCEDGNDSEEDALDLNREGTESAESDHDVSSNNAPSNLLNIVVGAEKGSISIDGTRNANVGSSKGKKNVPERSKTSKKCSKKQWYSLKLDDKEIMDVMEQNRNKPTFLEATLKCHSCAIVFPEESMLKIHNNAFHNEELGPYVCTICLSRFSECRQLSRHRSLHATTAYVCLCGFRTYCKRDIIAHGCTVESAAKKVVESDKKRPKRKDRVHGCKYCGKIFTSRGSIFQHVQLKHKELPRVQCDVCKRTLKNIYSLRQHVKIQHSEGARPPTSADNYCQLCDVWFNSKWTYRMHLKMSGSHADNKTKFKHQCDQCDHKFFYARLLETHKRIVHLKQKPFKCQQCGQSFSTKRRLQAHVDTKHLNKVVERKHVCEVCGAAFASGTTLRNHRYIHSTERPFKCAQCGDTFKQSAALYNHNRMVHQGFKREKI